jgi:Htaa
MNIARLSAVAALLLGGVLVVAPAAGAATPAPASASCTVQGGTLTWGVKESFRSYISGSIAKGGWEAGDGATYATPAFAFTGATGEIDPVSGAGRVAFHGSVHFTGHGGILDLTIASPTLRIDGDGRATLLLDVRGTDTSGAPAIDAKQTEIGTLAAAPAVDAAAGALTLSAVPLALSAAGAPAFGGFYAEGEELDPVTATVQLSCPAAEPVPVPTLAPSPSQTAVPAADAAGEPGTVPWIPITLGAVVVGGGAVATAIAIRRRR